MPTFFDQVDVTGGVPIRHPDGSSVLYIKSTTGSPVNVDRGAAFSYKRSINTSTTVKSGSGTFQGIVINNRIGQKIFIYDSTSKVNVRATASQCLNTVTVLDFPANNTIAPKSIEFNIPFTKGLIVIARPLTVTSVTDFTVSYR